MPLSGNKKFLWRSTIAILVAAACAVTFFWLSESGMLAIEDIQVEGNRAISTDEVLDRVGPLLRGQSLLNASFDDADRILMQLSYTESVEVERDFPHGITIRIREYRPFANLKTADNQVVILSAEGRALSQAPGLAPEYPVLATRQPCAVEVGSSAECPEAATGIWFLANIPVSFNQGFAEVTVTDGDINARTKAGVNVHFGSLDDYALKFEVLRQLLARTGAAGTNISLDVSVPQRPVTRDNTVTATTATTSTNDAGENADESQEAAAEPDTAVDQQAADQTPADETAADGTAADAATGEDTYAGGQTGGANQLQDGTADTPAP